MEEKIEEVEIEMDAVKKLFDNYEIGIEIVEVKQSIKETQKNKEQVQEVKPQKVKLQECVYNLPSSSHLHFLDKTITTTKGLTKLSGCSLNHGTSVSVDVDNNNCMYATSSNKKYETQIRMTNFRELTKSSKAMAAARKNFTFLMINANKQVFNKSEENGLIKNEIIIPLQEFVEAGLYEDVRSARRGIETSYKKVLSNIQIIATFKGKTASGMAHEQIFKSYLIENNCFTVTINKEINWREMFKYFTILPKYSFALNNRAFLLTKNIFYLARQNYKLISEKGYFTISFRNLQSILELPDENKTKDPGKYIRKPIEDAINEVNNADDNLKLKAVYDINSNTKEYLDKGKLEIYMNGDYITYITERNDKQQAAIVNRQKKIDKIIEQRINKKAAEEAAKQ